MKRILFDLKLKGNYMIENRARQVDLTAVAAGDVMSAKGFFQGN